MTLTRIAIALLMTIGATARGAEPFALREGDRVALIGSTLVERSAEYGQIETALTRRWPAADVTFRNLGWSGDTVTGIARARFGPVEEGYAHLVSHVKELEPTVLVISYGAVESFEGPGGVAGFRKGFERLLGDLDGAVHPRAVVILAPNRLEDLGRPLPDPNRHNDELRDYVATLEDIAKSRGYAFVDLFDRLPDGAKAEPPAPLTDDGMHLTAYGYWRAAAAIEDGLGLPPDRWSVSITGGDQPKAEAEGAAVSLLRTGNGGVRFRVKDDRLPPPPAPKGSPEGARYDDATRVLTIAGLPAGPHALAIDGKPVLTADAAAWAAGVALANGPEFEQVEALNSTINRKNRLYFYRWRPQNETYLFGFRKHEQGQNAREVPLFDPLVEEQERAIAGLRVPVPHTYEITPALAK